jgi:hypothetical protein
VVRAVLSLSSLIDFLLSLLRDPEAADEFARDPEGVLARHGLENITAADVRDVQPLLADCDGVVHRPGPGHHRRHDDGDDDPVRVIQHVTREHHVQREVVVREQHHHHEPQHHQTVEYKQYHSELHYTDNSVHVEEGGYYIRDSFNQDNDGVDNKGGIIDDSTVVVGDENVAGNTEETTTVVDSFDEDSSETVVISDSGNDSSDDSTTVTDSFDVTAGTAPAAPAADPLADTYASVQPADPADAPMDAAVEPAA